MLRKIILSIVSLVTLLAAASVFADEQNAADLFKLHKNRLYQIRLIDLASENKSSLGSGFLVDDSGIVATNYHVIESKVTHPGKFRIEYLKTDGSQGELTLLDVDVINDLALLSSPELASDAFQLSGQEIEQGDTIFSLGNPHDIGFTVVPGTYNGIDEHSYYRRIHFSGAINAGMSGGPTLDSGGRVVGINVSTAGNQISFLVPVEALQKLLDKWRTRPEQTIGLKSRILKQLTDNQQQIMDRFLAKSWSLEPFGQVQVLGEMSPFVKCWGGSSDPKSRLSQIASTCRSAEHIYLNRGFNTGIISYQFFWMEANKLNSWQFYNYYQNLFSSFMPDNSAGIKDATEFKCDEMFLDSEVGATEKSVLCTRAYKEYPGLFDIVFIGGTVHDREKAYVRHFTLAGVTRDNAHAFLEKFLEHTKWQ